MCASTWSDSSIHIIFPRFVHVVSPCISGLFVFVKTHTHTRRHLSITSMSMGHFLGLLSFLQTLFLNFQHRSLTIFYQVYYYLFDAFKWCFSFILKVFCCWYMGIQILLSISPVSCGFIEFTYGF